MFMVVPRWKVVVTLSDGTSHTVWIADMHIMNVLRTVAGMQFAESGLVQPTKILVTGEA